MTQDSTKVTGDGGNQPSGQATLQTTESPTSAVPQLASIQDNQQYAGADVKKLIQDALSADGRAQKDRADQAETTARALQEQVASMHTQITSVSTTLAEFRKSRDEAELMAVKDDPEALKSLRFKQQLRLENETLAQEKARLEAEKLAIASDKAEIARNKAEKEARRIANLAEYKVDPDRLFALVPDGNAERLKIAAKILKESSVVATTTTPPTTPPKPPGLTTRPASVISSGGSEGGLAKMLEKAKAKPK